MHESIEKASDIIVNSEFTIALTGAGISVESGIPDFRSADGLWSRYDPAEYAAMGTFMVNPVKVWELMKEMEILLGKAKPNAAHMAMGEMEKAGCLHYVITQNIDGLHQEGGSENVIEYHGTWKTLSCIWCGKKYTYEEKREQYPPQCECKRILKPDIVFFGEPIPEDAMTLSYRLASKAQALIIVGTSAVVSPANTIPVTAKENGAYLIEINTKPTHLTDSLTDVFLQGSAGKIMPELLTSVKSKIR